MPQLTPQQVNALYSGIYGPANGARYQNPMSIAEMYAGIYPPAAMPGNAGPVIRQGFGTPIETISAETIMPNGLTPMDAGWLSPQAKALGKPPERTVAADLRIPSTAYDYAPPIWASPGNTTLTAENKDQSRLQPNGGYPTVFPVGPRTAVAAIEQAVPPMPPPPRPRPPTDALALAGGWAPMPTALPPMPASRNGMITARARFGLDQTSPAEEMWDKTEFGGGSNIYPAARTAAVPGGASPYALDPTGSGQRQADAGLGQINALFRSPLAGLIALLSGIGGSSRTPGGPIPLTGQQARNQNPQALAALLAGQNAYTVQGGENANMLMPTVSISGKPRNTYGD